MAVMRLFWTSLMLLFLILQDGYAEDKPRKISMRIVEEPSNYGYGNQVNSGVRTLTPRVKASNVSGPAPLQQLAGRCYSKVLGNYKYKFCPFYNVTQYEQSLRWNPYSGILGVWQEWEIENNTFTSMVMPEGDDCGGSRRRQVKVYFRCGNKNQVMNVTEPTTCNYMLEFKTPLVCHPHVMLVYPTLSEDLQLQWDQVEQELYEEQITQKGYKKRLRRIFEAAGYQLSQKKQEELKAAVSSQDKTKDGDFTTLQQCNAEYKKLREEVETLKEQIKTQEERFPEADDLVLEEHALDYDLMDDYL
ncbi:N-acetylglucosamine-1-phosphotransferase subunit gamma-like isoform X1 [Branchiostoma lanceolatum]|uniref:N-acetylglucosamine-1-phosphotransferase subunit gamma-like isoform X1 n=1 Tax=Branchiostoma lanceolatum TaxID=7740 RepID=UPI0034539EA8